MLLGGSLLLFLILVTAGLQTGIIAYQLFWVFILSTADLGTFQPPKSCEPIPSSKFTYLIGSISLENPDSYTESSP